MNELYIGIAILISIVFAQFAVARLKRARMLRAWTDAEEAMRQGRFEDAETSLTRCNSIAPLWMHGAVALAMVQGKLGKTDLAEQGLLRACELHRNEAEPEYALGVFYATLVKGREDEALSAFNKAVQRDPSYLKSLAVDPRFEALRSHPDFPKAKP